MCPVPGYWYAPTTLCHQPGRTITLALYESVLQDCCMRHERVRHLYCDYDMKSTVLQFVPESERGLGTIQKRRQPKVWRRPKPLIAPPHFQLALTPSKSDRSSSRRCGHAALVQLTSAASGSCMAPAGAASTSAVTAQWHPFTHASRNYNAKNQLFAQAAAHWLFTSAHTTVGSGLF
eukprot:1823957-Rhodomonas_salina.1